MKKISEAVEEVLLSSDVALEAMRSGLLNLSAFAEKIQPEVEEKTWKSVKKSTIVVALARYSKEIHSVAPLRPRVELDELSIKSPLCEVTFEKTQKTVDLSRGLFHQIGQDHSHFLTVTEGISEITIISSDELLPKILKHFQVEPRATYRELVGVSVKFSERYLQEPNVIYSILSLLATKRVNLIEIVSTYTELTMIIQKSEMDRALQVLNTFFRKT